MTKSPKPIERREGHFISEGEGQSPCELFYQTWTGTDSRGTLVVTHGISEHSECYAKTAESLVNLGWDILAWDLRGHGRSEGKRGYVEHFTDYCRDLGAFLRHMKKGQSLEKPFALVGHSMGGLITLRYLIEPSASTPIPGAASLSSPFLGLAIQVPFVKGLAAQLLNNVWPSFTMYNEIRYEYLTRDPEFLASYPKDTLRHGKISPALFLGMLKAIEEVKAAPDKIQLPILVQAAGQDKIVNLGATREFFPRIADKRKKLIVYEESYHEIFNDLDRVQVFRDLNAFLKEQLGI
jgi:alpha-beta hydrolase superfamily lysophospholipase